MYKETVIKPKELKRINDAMPSDAKYGDVFEAIANNQAEITWPIAEKAGYEKGLANAFALEDALYNKIAELKVEVKEAEQRGIQKVAEYIDSHCYNSISGWHLCTLDIEAFRRGEIPKKTGY